ncbi:SET domain containing protein [uncultured Caudovirales phage]|uniref:SET domain containing protein n=1 Tax=uncultured Caudovirales phage TaxID=2100421 RepID=A0A6J5P3I3_9CAUD|nr:SET domain containing protein [uncultured Caudovirales phage]CAB4165857.1 SET domain containing protein [uncultured Caudovirales phage]CAB4186913.1 SET domain containing protein [uncultured Caudovirales phage]CAB4221410.1 SET domain containing protein [uncultured Caudovirales phage]
MRANEFVIENSGRGKIEVKPSPGKGNGLFATQLIKKGEKFIESPSITMSDDDWQKVKNTEPSKLYGFIADDEHAVPFGPILFKFNNPKDKAAWASTEICKKHCPNGLSLSGFMFINDDQKSPNAEEDFPDNGSSVGMIALRDINPGEEITKKYNMQGNWTK